MNRLDQTRLIVNQPLDETHTKQEYEFVDEQSFLTWFEIEKNRFGWISNGTYPGTRKSMSGSIQSARYNTEWSRYFLCPFSSKNKSYVRRAKPRPNQKPSIKVGCKASIRATKRFDDPKIRVYYNGNHINHQPDSLESWQRRRLSPVLRNWLKDVVAAGINWEAFKVLAIPNQETLDTLNSGRLRSDEAIRISEMLRINSDDFYNFRRSHRKTLAQYDTDCWKSLLLHSDVIRQEGGLALNTKICRRNGCGDDFVFAFCTSWQVSLFRRYQSLLCLDSTHNTCCALESSRAAYLHSIVIKNDDAGCGVPVAFMITSTETMEPLVEWLKWLKDAVPFVTTPIFMIDCSKTEVAAIKVVFPEPKIRFCHWHFFRAVRSQANGKISDPSDRRSAFKEFKALVWTRSTLEFNDMWEKYQSKYEMYKDWMTYLKVQWMNDIDKWWVGCRTGMLDINTNNLVESWHNVLKTRYLKGARKQRTDMLVHILLEEVLESIRIKVLLSLNGFQSRRLNLAEQNQQKKCNEIPTELAMTFVSHTNDPESCDELGKEILVKSLTKENVQYSVLLNEDGLISRCTCDYMSKSLVVCKHMYLAARVLGYTISFDIRETEASCNELLPTPQLSSVEGDPKNILSADFRQVIQRVEDVVDDYNNLEEQDQALCQDALDKLRAVSAIRNRANRQIAWSERQRR